MSHAPANLLTAWADALLSALADAAIRDVIASPGSRSTPFLLAAAREPRLRVHSVVDERAAAFFALGKARVTGRPPLLLCTSGSAPAHYYPAVIEASEAALPLVVLSADRPRELMLAGAPQTTDQHRLYGSHARAFADLGDPHPSEAALRGLRRTAAELVRRAIGPEPGPVQINAPARKPLEPVEPSTDEERALAARVAALPPAPRALVRRPEIDTEALRRVARALDEAERPAIVAGPARRACAAVLALARRAGLPLMAEASSQLRFTERAGVVTADGFGHWIEGAAPAPDLVLEVGATPTSGEYARWLAAGGPRRRFVLGGPRFRDPSGTAEAVILGDPEAIFETLARWSEARPRSGWIEEVRTTELRAWSAVEGALAAQPFGEAQAVAAVVGALAPGSRLALGNSLPIRDVDRFVPGERARASVTSARGVNGIDGWIAGCAGAATADGAPTVAILGDVTTAHDIGSLQLAARVRTPLVYVVIDNGGGRIFEELPIAGAIDAETFELFSTPTAIRLAPAAEAFGIRYEAAADAASVRAAVKRGLSEPGPSLVHVRVPARSARDALRRVREELA